MKNLFTSFFTLVVFLVGTIAFAQNSNSLLWKVSGNGLEKPSYIFGTIHMICEDDYFMNESVEKALADSEVLITEINFGNMAEMMQMQSAMQTDKPLKERISSEQYNKLEKLLKAKLGLDISDFNSVSEAGIASLVTVKSFPCEQQKMYEIELFQKAMLSQKKLNGLESIAEQMKVMQDHFNIEAIIKMLEDVGSADDTNKEMVTLYKEQKIDALLDLLKKASYMDAKAYDEFVVIRNNNWIAKMPELMKSNAAFFAVGAAHLGSEDGVLELLREKGYKVEAVN